MTIRKKLEEYARALRSDNPGLTFDVDDAGVWWPCPEEGVAHCMVAAGIDGRVYITYDAAAQTSHLRRPLAQHSRSMAVSR